MRARLYGYCVCACVCVCCIWCPVPKSTFYDFQNRTKRIDEIKITTKSNQLSNDETLSSWNVCIANRRKQERDGEKGIANEIKINSLMILLTRCNSLKRDRGRPHTRTPKLYTIFIKSCLGPKSFRKMFYFDDVYNNKCLSKQLFQSLSFSSSPNRKITQTKVMTKDRSSFVDAKCTNRESSSIITLLKCDNFN